MKKWFYVFAVLCMACVGFTACGGDDDDPIVEEKKEETEQKYVPVESVTGKMLRDCPITFAMYNEISKWDGSLFFSSTDKDKNYNNIDRVQLELKIANNPGYGKWSGRYTITEAEATSISAKGKLTDLVATVYNETNTNHGWIEFEYLGEKNTYDQKQYKITVHIIEMINSKGDYARNVDLTITTWL